MTNTPTPDRPWITATMNQGVENMTRELDSADRELRQARELLGQGLAIDSYLRNLGALTDLRARLNTTIDALMLASHHLGERNVRIANAGGVSESYVSRLVKTHRDDWQGVIEDAAKS